MEKIKITGSIVLYKNDRKMLKECIKSFFNTSINVHLYLVDNSPNTELKSLEKLNVNISYISNPSNPGFGASHNIVIDKILKTESSYHLILNPDIYYVTDVLKDLKFFMDKNHEIGHIMPKVTYPNGDYQFLCKRNPTFFDMLVRGVLPKFLKIIFIRRLNKFEYKDHNYDEKIYNVPYLSGCFMLFRTSTLKKVGYFDDRFFMYLEDADITRRFLQVSKTLYYPDVQIFHHFAKFTHSSFKFKWITIKSAFVYFKKWGFLKHLI